VKIKSTYSSPKTNEIVRRNSSSSNTPVYDIYKTTTNTAYNMLRWSCRGPAVIDKTKQRLWATTRAWRSSRHVRHGASEFGRDVQRPRDG